MTTIKDRLKLFESSPPPLKPKPLSPAFLNHKKPSFPELDTSVTKDEPVPNDSKSPSAIDDVNHNCAESHSPAPVIEQIQNPDSRTDSVSNESGTVTSEIHPDDIRSKPGVVLDEESISNQFQNDDGIDVRETIDHDSPNCSDSEFSEDLDYELCGSTYTFPGVENFVLHEIEHVPDSDPVSADQPVEIEPTRIEPIVEPDKIEDEPMLEEDKNELKRSASKRLIEEIFNTSIWRHSRNYDDDFIFSPTVETTAAGPDLSGPVEVRPSDSFPLASTGSDERRKSSQSVSSMKTGKKNFFGGIFKSMRSGKKSHDKNSPEKSRGPPAANDLYDMDGPAKAVHQTDEEMDSLGRTPKKPLNMIFNRDWLNSLGEGIKKKANVMSELRKVFSSKGKAQKKKASKNAAGPSIEKKEDPKILINICEEYVDDDDIYDDGEVDFTCGKPTEIKAFLAKPQELKDLRSGHVSDNDSIYDDGGSEAEIKKDADDDDIYDDGGDEPEYLRLENFGITLEKGVEMRMNSAQPLSSTTQTVSNCDSIYDCDGDDVLEVAESPKLSKDKYKETYHDKKTTESKKLYGQIFGTEKTKHFTSSGCEEINSKKPKQDKSATPLMIQQLFKGFSKGKVKNEKEKRKNQKTEEYDSDNNVEEYQEDVEQNATTEKAKIQSKQVVKGAKIGPINDDIIYDEDNDVDLDQEVYADDADDVDISTEKDCSVEKIIKAKQVGKKEVLTSKSDGGADDIYDEDNEEVEGKLSNSVDLIKAKKEKEKITDKMLKKEKKTSADKNKSLVSKITAKKNEREKKSIVEVYDEDTMIVTNNTESKNKIYEIISFKKNENTTGDNIKNAKQKCGNDVRDKLEKVTEDIYDEDEMIEDNKNMSKESLKPNVILIGFENIKENQKGVDYSVTESNTITTNTTIINKKNKKVEKEKEKKKSKDKGKDKGLLKNCNNTDVLYDEDIDLIQEHEIVNLKEKNSSETMCKKEISEKDKNKEKKKSKEKDKVKGTCKNKNATDILYDDDGIIQESEINKIKEKNSSESICRKENSEKDKKKEKKKSKEKDKEKGTSKTKMPTDMLYDIDEIIEDIEINKVKQKTMPEKVSNKEVSVKEGKEKLTKIQSELKSALEAKIKVIKPPVIEETYDEDDIIPVEEKVKDIQTKPNKKTNKSKDTMKETKVNKTKEDKSKNLKGKPDKKPLNKHDSQDDVYDVDNCIPDRQMPVVDLKGKSKEAPKKEESKNKHEKVEKRPINEEDIYDEDESIPNESIPMVKIITKDKKSEDKRLKDKDTKKQKSELKMKKINNKNVSENTDKSEGVSNKISKLMKVKESSDKNIINKINSKNQYIEEYDSDTNEPQSMIDTRPLHEIDRKYKKNEIEEYDEDCNIEEYISDVESIDQEKDKFGNKMKTKMRLVAELIQKQNKVVNNLNHKTNTDLQNQKDPKAGVPITTVHQDERSFLNRADPEKAKFEIFQTDDPEILKLRKKNFDSAKKIFKLKEPVVPVGIAKAVKMVYSQVKNHLQMNIGELLEVLEFRDDLILVRNSIGKYGWVSATNVEIIESRE